MMSETNILQKRLLRGGKLAQEVEDGERETINGYLSYKA